MDKSVLSRPLLGELTINWELVAYASIVLVAVATRFWDLGSRALHHDESLHALYSWYLYTGKGYTHDPMMHGPFLFHANALVYLLFGASDYTARVMPALFGVGVVIAPYFLRREMGRVAAVVASLLFALSPTFLYFSRFLRNDIYMAGWAMLMIVGLFGYFRERKSGYLYLFVLGAALSFATKETVYITGFAFFVFFVLEVMTSALRRRSSVVWSAVRSMSARDWVISIALFLTINLLLYTTFFTNPKGVISGTTGALSYWLTQQGVQRGGQPWFYYLILVPLYEFLPLMAALGGLVFVAVRGRLLKLNLFTYFALVWLIVVCVDYSWAGEKMPWLAVHIAQPLILLAAISLAGLLKRVDHQMFSRGPALLVMALSGLVAAVVLGGLVAAPPMAGTQLGMASAQLQRWGMELLAVLLVVSLVVVGRQHGARAVLVPASLILLAGLAVLSVRTAWEVTYSRGDIPRDMLVYVQTSPDVPKIVQEIDRLSFQTGAGKDMKILLDGGYTDNVGGQSIVHESIAWPFEWYLRDYKGKSYFSRTLPAGNDAAVVLTMVANEDPIRDQLLANYVPVRGRLNWWYPEDYKSLTWQKVWDGLRNPSTRAQLWRYFLYKETLNPLGSRDIDFWVRSDLARGISMQPAGAPAVPAAAAAAQVSPSDVVAQTAAGGITIFGKTSTGGSILSEPRGVAQGPDGTLYVVDSAANKVVAFRPNGSVLTQWGRKGSGDGEFTEPWGIAVASNGDVYVADTWNHRIQKFDKTGKFLAKWGSFADTKGQVDAQQGALWGPRSIAFTSDGKVLVTDTGNKRVEVFDSNGQFIAAFGGDGTAPGKMKEPVGIATDGAGNIYVADTWNKRIQKFDSQYRFVAQFPVSGWDSQSVSNKPYLAVDHTGQIYFTDPEKNHFVVMSPTGSVEGSKGTLGAGPSSFNLPTGIAVSTQGEVFVADARNSRVVKYQSGR